MNKLIYDELVNAIEKELQFPSPKSRKAKNIPYRIKWRGQYVATKSGKTVWSSLGAAKNAFWHHIDLLNVPSLPPRKNHIFKNWDYRDLGDNIIIHHIYEKEYETMRYLNKRPIDIQRKLRAQFLKQLEEDGILEFEPQNS